MASLVRCRCSMSTIDAVCWKLGWVSRTDATLAGAAPQALVRAVLSVAARLPPFISYWRRPQSSVYVAVRGRWVLFRSFFSK